MKKLEDIKKHKDRYCTKFVQKQIDLIKKHFKIEPNKRVFAFYIWCRREYFLCGNTVYIARFGYNDKKELFFTSLYRAELEAKNEINFETIIPDDTAPKFEELFDGEKLDVTQKLYTKEEFLIWLNSPCTTTDEVSIPFKDAIKFLQNYKKDTFKTKNYLFYVKRDNDYTWSDYFYAYDLRNKTELKLYCSSFITTYLPERSRDIFIEDLSGKLSEYQKNKCKKEFMTFMKETCLELKTINFYALEFVKQCIQPIEKDRGWAVNKPFAGDFKFTNIWIDDYLAYDKKPYFVITEGDNEWLSQRACAIDFFKPEYKSSQPYISGCYKRIHWNMDKETLEKLTAFLKAPFDYKKTFWYKRAKKTGDTQTVKNLKELEYKTNWQWLIAGFNENFMNREKELTLDLPMPDYTKLLKYTS